jgi:AcrR family transcriptional regulator
MMPSSGSAWWSTVPARAGLDRAAVVRAAAALLDESAGHALSLGEVADRLGVRAPSLYNHVAGLDDLRQAVGTYGLQCLASCLGRAAIGKAGDDAVLAIADAYRAFATEHPGVYLLTLQAPAADDAERRALSEEILAILRAVLASYRLAPAEMVHAMRGLRSIAHGFVSLELAGGFGLPVERDESYHRLLETFMHGLRESFGQPDRTNERPPG